MKKSETRFVLGLLLIAIVNGGCASEPPIRYRIHHDYSVADMQFPRTIGTLLGPPLIAGNNVVALNNGDEIFPSMYEALRSAQKTIALETFIYWSGSVGSKMTDLLCERASAGVKVKVIIDWVGSGLIDRKFLKRMESAGIAVVQYHPLKWYELSSAARLNNRTHRKLLIVDGKVGFTGGVGIADEWSGHAEMPKHYRDLHFRIEGPVVAQLQSAFLDNWMKTTGEVLDGPEFFPPLESRGQTFCQMFKSGPTGGSESMELLYLLSIAAAEHSVLIGNAYFVPGPQTIDALLYARRRGVKVQIIVPGPNIDEKIVQPASKARWGELLKEGVEIFEYQPTMYHTKLLIVDDSWVSVGSTNLDNRSFRMNDEANLNVLDPEFAQHMTKIFNADLAASKQVTFHEWSRRPWTERFSEFAASIIAPLL